MCAEEAPGRGLSCEPRRTSVSLAVGPVVGPVCLSWGGRKGMAGTTWAGGWRTSDERAPPTSVTVPHVTGRGGEPLRVGPGGVLALRVAAVHLLGWAGLARTTTTDRRSHTQYSPPAEVWAPLWLGSPRASDIQYRTTGAARKQRPQPAGQGRASGPARAPHRRCHVGPRESCGREHESPRATPAGLTDDSGVLGRRACKEKKKRMGRWFGLCMLSSGSSSISVLPLSCCALFCPNHGLYNLSLLVEAGDKKVGLAKLVGHDRRDLYPNVLSSRALHAPFRGQGSWRRAMPVKKIHSF